MLDQIHEELEPYQETGISLQDIENTWQALSSLPSGCYKWRFARFKIANNQVRFQVLPRNQQEDWRMGSSATFFRKLAQVYRLPDAEFIVCSLDSFERPVHLESAHCPILITCRLKSGKKSLLIPELWKLRERSSHDSQVKSPRVVQWKDKIETAFWRGATTGGLYTQHTWDSKPRPRLVLFSQDNPDLVDARFSDTPYILDSTLRAFIAKEFVAPWTSPEASLTYKYLIAIDGHTFPSNFEWVLLSNSTALKGESDYVEWFYRGLEPYVHYVPFKQDCSDLAEKIEWLRENDEIAHRIARNGTEFVLNNLSLSQLYYYCFILLQEYAKLLH
jgi:hypothetical protein